MNPITTMSVLIEAEQPLILVNFWAAIFGVPVSSGSTTDCASLSPNATTVQLVFERTLEPKLRRNRVRLQLVTQDFDAQLDRLKALGTEFDLTDMDDSSGARRALLTDLEGNEFTLCARAGVS